MKAIFLIHGFLTNKDDFKAIVPSLNEMYDKVYLYEAPGHTLEPNYALFNVNDTFKTLLKAYDELAKDYDTIDVIGFSMGGALATYLQSVRRVRNLVLLAPANKYINPKLLGERLKFITQNHKDMIKMKDTNPKAYDYIKNNMDALKKDDKNAMTLAFKYLFPNWTIKNLSTFTKIINKCNKELIAITSPTLIIWGKLDQLVPYDSIKYLESLMFSNSEVVIYDDISHLMLNSENNNKIIDKICNFLKERGNI